GIRALDRRRDQLCGDARAVRAPPRAVATVGVPRPLGDVARKIEHPVGGRAVGARAREVRSGTGVAARPLLEPERGASADEAREAPREAPALAPARREAPLGGCRQPPLGEATEALGLGRRQTRDG